MPAVALEQAGNVDNFRRAIDMTQRSAVPSRVRARAAPLPCRPVRGARILMVLCASPRVGLKESQGQEPITNYSRAGRKARLVWRLRATRA